MYEVRQVDFSKWQEFEVVDIHPRGDIVEGRYATEDEAIDKAKELNILESITERYEDEVQLLQQSLRAWVDREALDAGIDVTVLEQHVGYGENTL